MANRYPIEFYLLSLDNVAAVMGEEPTRTLVIRTGCLLSQLSRDEVAQQSTEGVDGMIKVSCRYTPTLEGITQRDHIARFRGNDYEIQGIDLDGLKRSKIYFMLSRAA